MKERVCTANRRFRSSLQDAVQREEPREHSGEPRAGAGRRRPEGGRRQTDVALDATATQPTASATASATQAPSTGVIEIRRRSATSNMR